MIMTNREEGCTASRFIYMHNPFMPDVENMVGYLEHPIDIYQEFFTIIYYMNYYQQKKKNHNHNRRPIMNRHRLYGRHIDYYERGRNESPRSIDRSITEGYDMGFDRKRVATKVEYGFIIT